MMFARLGIVVLTSAACWIALGAGPAAAAPDYCGLLGPADFAAAGVPGAGAPKVNPAEAGAYCVYAGKSAGTGGIEFDVFVTEGGVDADQVFINARSFPNTSGISVKDLPGADDVALDARVGTPAYATIAVRTRKLVFDIGIPAGPKAQAALITLAKLVLKRGDALSR